MRKKHYVLRYLSGKWSTQERLLIFKNKNQKVSEKNLSFSHREKSRIVQDRVLIIDINKKNQDHMDSFLFRVNIVNEERKGYFLINFTNKNLLKIIKISYNLHTILKEYIYIVNKNIIVSIVILLNKYGQYLGIKVSSYIKLK